MCCACVDGSAQATHSKLGRNQPPIVLKEFGCDGTETNLAQCPEAKNVCLFPGAGVICPAQNGNFYVLLL